MIFTQNSRELSAPNNYPTRLAVTRIYLSRSREIFYLTALAWFCTVFFVFFPTDLDAWPVISIAAAYFFILINGCYHQCRLSPIMMWSPLVWFRLGSAIFLGFGSIVPYIVDHDTREYMNGVFLFTNLDVLRLLMASILSTLVVITVARFFWVASDKKSVYALLSDASSSKILTAAILLLFLGFLSKYFIILGPLFGFGNFEYSGWVGSLSKAYAAGLFLLLLWALQHARRWLWLPLGLITIDVGVGLLIFDKSEVVFTLAFSYLAFLYSNFSLTRAAAGVAGLALVLFIIQPFVHYGRQQVKETVDERHAVTIEKRTSILLDYFTGGEQPNDVPSRSMLARLSSVAPGTWVMNRFDQGLPGDRHANAFAAFVPRILWPDKPALGSAGGEAYMLLRGRTGASLGVGHFAEAYWSFGWLGIPIVFIPGGIILSIVTVRSVSLIMAGRWAQLPVVLFALNMGYKVEGSWVGDVVGSFAIFIGLTVLISALERIVGALDSSKAGRAACFIRNN